MGRPRSAEELSVDAFIDRLLSQSSVNCTYVPDFIERDIYRNLLRIILGNLSQVIRSVRVEILNHVITINMEPMSATPAAPQNP